MSFHQRLKHERLAKGWSIEQLSQASGVTVNRIALLERNLVELVSDNLKECLAKALGVDFNAPPSALPGSVQAPAITQPASAPAPVAARATEPFALHLSTQLQQQLEAAAHAQGRSLHGEILARLEASLGEGQTVVSSPRLAAPADASGPSSTSLVLSESDWDYLTEQVALRLQARP